VYVAGGILAFLFTGCGGPNSPAQKNESVLVFAAASTKEAVEQIARDFQAETATPVEINLGPSSGLAKQIEQGASADLFLSADQASADYLAKKTLIELRRNLLTNRLVVIVPAEGQSAPQLKELRDLADPKVHRLAMAEPGVPAGEYAREALRHSGILEQVQSRIVGGVDVRATLQFVARGEVDAGLVYYTDTVGNSKVRIAFEVNPDLHAPILYPLVLIRKDHIQDAARRFYEYLASEKAAKVFRAAHFGMAR
jgi:molybdate transport system substrate-binding protein